MFIAGHVSFNESKILTISSKSIQKQNMSSTTIKVWIVRNSASNVQFGGLERLFVHFSKPTFYYQSNRRGTGDLPFSEETDKCGIYEEAGWKETQSKTWVPAMSVGNWLGYDNKLSHYIWEKLVEHFKGQPIQRWDSMEQCLEVRRESFCLELDIQLSII